MILLDTNVVSELMLARPNPAVLAFLAGCRPNDIFLPSICEAELRYGCMRLPPGRRRADLEARLETAVSQTFPGRVLPFDRACATGYAAVRSARERAGRPASTADALIGGMALAHGATLVTRNLADFDGYGVMLVDPWQHS